MILLDDNNSCVEPTHLMVTLAVVTTWCIQIDACRWWFMEPWRADDDVHGALESWWWSLDGLIDCDVGDGAYLMWWSPDYGDGAYLMWWSPNDGDGACLMMMQLGDALMMPYVFIDVLMMPYVFTVFIDACGWIPCHMMPWSHGSRSWWRCDGCLMSFGHVDDDMIHSCDWCDALMSLWALMSFGHALVVDEVPLPLPKPI